MIAIGRKLDCLRMFLERIVDGRDPKVVPMGSSRNLRSATAPGVPKEPLPGHATARPR
ncbi:MAG: hypothetical protein K8T20_15860 [Planctomycetes bacterium]|nr:hypothetical protein [Planctomycetota bacterium]